MAMMFVVGRLAAKVQPKHLIVAGGVIIALFMYDLTTVYGDSTSGSSDARECCSAWNCR
jgi:hypothetical protein